MSDEGRARNRRLPPRLLWIQHTTGDRPFSAPLLGAFVLLPVLQLRKQQLYEQIHKRPAFAVGLELFWGSVTHTHTHTVALNERRAYVEQAQG